MRVFEEKQCSVIATQIVEGPAISAYGVIDAKAADGNGRLYQVHNMVEKPALKDAPSNLAIIGRYILTPAVFDVLTRTQVGAGGELQLTDALKLMLKQEKMYAYVYEGKRHDTGISNSKNLCGQNSRICRSWLANRNCRDGNARGHLYGGEKRIHPIQRRGWNRHSNDGQCGVRRNHSGKMRCAACAGDYNANS